MRSAAILALVLAVAGPAGAQSAAAPLDVRMRRFIATLTADRSDDEAFAAFFPRRGEWRRVMTIHRPGRPDSVEARSFGPGALPAAARPGGPLCSSFQPGLPGAVSAAMGSLAGAVEERPRGWRRVRGNRFVPPSSGVRSPVFVEWGREDGQWVIAAIGEETDYAAKLLGVEANPFAVRRDPSPTPLRLPLRDARYAAGAPWYERREKLYLDEFMYWAFGLPRTLREDDVVRIGSVQGVGVYVEPRYLWYPEYLYLPVDDAGSFQPYQVLHPDPCAWGAPKG
jgi:hypothetical protein